MRVPPTTSNRLVANSVLPPEGAPDSWARWITRRPRIGLTDIYHDNAARRGAAAKWYVALFGTPNLGTFANGLHLKRVLRGFVISSVLDAGCGDGTFSLYLASRYPDAQITGVDIGEQGEHTSESTLDVGERIRRRLGLQNLRFQKLDLRELRIRQRFDFVYSFDVLEHIAENRDVLARIYDALTPGGVFLLRIPTRVQKRILPARYTEEHARWAAIEHVGQHYEMDTLLADLKAIGFDVLWSRSDMGFFGRLSFELLEALRYYRAPAPLLFGVIPVLKALRYLDTRIQSRGGDGVLALCRKPATPGRSSHDR